MPSKTRMGTLITKGDSERHPPSVFSPVQVLSVVRRTAALADLRRATDPHRLVRGRAAEDGPECEWRGFALLALDIMVDLDGALWLLEVWQGERESSGAARAYSLRSWLYSSSVLRLWS